MTVQLRINTDTIVTTLEIPEVSVIRPLYGKISLSLRKPIASTLREKDITTLLIAPKDDLEVINKGYAILVNRALIERVSL